MPAVLAFRWPRCVAACWFAARCWWQPVAVSGSIAWMGLVVPHLARLLVGADHRRLLPTAFWLGAALMLVVDDLARTLTRRRSRSGSSPPCSGRRCLPCCWCNPDAGVRPDEQLIIAAIATLWPPSAALRPAHAGLPARWIWAVLGANGRGKSTLLDTLTGVLPPLGGEMQCEGGVARFRSRFVPLFAGA